MPPCSSSKLTSFKAFSPAKFLLTRSSLRIGGTNSPRAHKDAERAIKQSDESRGFKQNNQNQQGTIDQQTQLGKRCDQLIMDQSINDAANHRSPDCADSPDNRHEQNGHANTEREHTLGMNEPCVLSVDASGCPREGSGQCVCQQLSTKRVYSQVGGGILILADRDERQPKSRTPNLHGGGHSQHRQCQRNIKVLQLAERAGLENPVAAGTAGQGNIRHHNAHRFADTDGCNREIRTSQTKGGKTDYERCHQGHARRQEQRRNRRESAVDRQCSSVRPEAVENCKTEGDLSAKPSENVPRDTHGNPHEGDEEKPNSIWAWSEPGKSDENRYQQSESKYAAVSDEFHARRRLLFQSPATPPGSTTRATTSKEKAIAGW